MRWSTGDRSNIEDMRGGGGRGGFGMVPMGIGGFILLALLSMFTGVNFFSPRRWRWRRPPELGCGRHDRDGRRVA